jgi:hypothetical protein
MHRAEEALWDAVRAGGNRVVTSVNDRLEVTHDFIPESMPADVPTS